MCVCVIAGGQAEMCGVKQHGSDFPLMKPVNERLCYFIFMLLFSLLCMTL